MIRIPEKLIDYIDYINGKMIAKNLPKELEIDFIEFKKEVERLEKENFLCEF